MILSWFAVCPPVINTPSQDSSNLVVDASSVPYVGSYVGPLVRNAVNGNVGYGHVRPETGVSPLGDIQNAAIHFLFTPKIKVRVSAALGFYG